MEGFFPSPAGGWVTSAPRKITGCWNTEGLQKKKKKVLSHTCRWTVGARLLLNMGLCFCFSQAVQRLPYQVLCPDLTMKSLCTRCKLLQRRNGHSKSHCLYLQHDSSGEKPKSYTFMDSILEKLLFYQFITLVLWGQLSTASVLYQPCNRWLGAAAHNYSGLQDIRQQDHLPAPTKYAPCTIASCSDWFQGLRKSQENS